MSDQNSPQYLPVESPPFVEAFLREHYPFLSREAERQCRRYNIPDFSGDVINITIEKFMTSRIEDRGPRSAISFAVRILQNTCIDEARRRHRQAKPVVEWSNDDDDGNFIDDHVAANDHLYNPERSLTTHCEERATALGFEFLPIYLRKTHRNVERDLEIVYKRHVQRLSWEEIQQIMPTVKAHRQSAARGRELLRGWVHALCGTQPQPDAANQTYWQRGYETGNHYRQKHNTGLVLPPQKEESS